MYILYIYILYQLNYNDDDCSAILRIKIKFTFKHFSNWQTTSQSISTDNWLTHYIRVGGLIERERARARASASEREREEERIILTYGTHGSRRALTPASA